MIVRLLLMIFLLLPGSALLAQTTDAESLPPSRLSELLGAEADEDFARALEPRAFSFPEDHGPHHEFRNEWWYFTGNLDSDEGLRFGFELTIFRFALTPAAPVSKSSWRTNQVYIAHLALTDAETERFYVAQRLCAGRDGPGGCAGWSASGMAGGLGRIVGE